LKRGILIGSGNTDLVGQELMAEGTWIVKEIKVVEYNPCWQSEFEKASKFYGKLLETLEVRIEHVGSTAVKGLWAKPILDIDIIVPDLAVSASVINRLKGVGYEHVGNYGVEGREAFKYSDDNGHICWMAHHLYVCLEGSENLNNHLMLRNHLRHHPSAVRAYSQLKQELASKFPNDMDGYIDGKTELITSFLIKEGMDIGALKRITEINKKES